MKVEMSLPDIMNMIKEIERKPEQISEIIQVDIRKNIRLIFYSKSSMEKWKLWYMRVPEGEFLKWAIW